MNKAVQRELLQYADDDTLKFTIDPEDDDVSKLRVTLSPPEDSPYENGIFFLSMTIPQQYPSSPPSIKFETKIYHPNINDDGTICLEQLKTDWKPNYTLKHAIEFIYSLMANPNWDSPLVASIGAQHEKDPAAFEQTAREWTETYAV
ncbi:Ubiquitin-conjugating enzyme family protein [Tritrichomonas foetus]|uniref:E2 ubiquitin-conjugating enzyme n=1 Tax=Tritrichomonas foetus TaxID=1144522 RepID=A0A1J4J8C7_9EUKA|nr:Ubiquitin-conjugating enzyme family protein [Tritrichomonas foetus]|eukprot:OHS95430.1 Ubiquitin-conjugating enzyme family protein [Tritrichomonas foetus]